MNHSEVLQFEAADNCNPGVETPKRRATPRKIPGISKSPERGYLSTDRALLGNGRGSLYGMLILGQLRYCFEPHEKTGKPKLAQRVHEGFYWAACSHTYFERQLGLTRKEVRVGLECLKMCPLVVMKAFEFGNSEVMHYRLTDCAQAGTPTDTKCAQAGTPPAQTGTPPAQTGTATSLKCDFEVDLEVKDIHAENQPEVQPGGKESGKIENLSLPLETTPTPVPVETTSSFVTLVASYKHKKPTPSPQPPAEASVPDIATEDVTEPAQAAVDVPSLDAISIEDEWGEAPLDSERCQPTPDELKKHFYQHQKKNLTAHA